MTSNVNAIGYSLLPLFNVRLVASYIDLLTFSDMQAFYVQSINKEILRLNCRHNSKLSFVIIGGDRFVVVWTIDSGIYIYFCLGGTTCSAKLAYYL